MIPFYKVQKQEEEVLIDEDRGEVGGYLHGAAWEVSMALEKSYFWNWVLEPELRLQRKNYSTCNFHNGFLKTVSL